MRKRTPGRYPIRHYPDITHSMKQQYRVPDWHEAYRRTEGHEPVNPRPHDNWLEPSAPRTAGLILRILCA
jgi:hypothetical protein